MRYFPSTNRQALLCISRPFKKVIDWHLIYLKNKQLFQKILEYIFNYVKLLVCDVSSNKDKLRHFMINSIFLGCSCRENH